ncbi:MAG: hypothetical protein QNK04_28050 [Myxococcota bacterium]|nr:hypothetical protein [Myxococcota bacterium]
MPGMPENASKGRILTTFNDAVNGIPGAFAMLRHYEKYPRSQQWLDMAYEDVKDGWVAAAALLLHGLLVG